MKEFGVSLVMPVLNEQEIIAETIRIFLKDLSGLFDKYELIIVNDASTDKTQSIVEQLVSECPDKLKLINNSRNLGGGSSLLIGFKAARFPYIVTNFADRPFALPELKNIMPMFSKGADFVVVSRFDRSANSLYRKLTSLVNYYLIKMLFRVNVGDFQFVQVYKKSILENLLIKAKRTFVPPEIIIKALRRGYRMQEYKSRFYARSKGGSKCGHPKVIFAALKDMFYCWWELNREG